MSQASEIPVETQSIRGDMARSSQNSASGSHVVDHLSRLPTELLILIFTEISVKDILCCQLLSRKFYAIIQDDRFWKQIYLTQFEATGKKTIPNLRLISQSVPDSSQEVGLLVDTSEDENTKDYWLRQCMLCYRWDRGLCHSYRFEFPSLNHQSLRHFSTVHGKTLFYLEGFEHVGNPDCSPGSRAWMLHIQDLHPEAKVDMIVVREATEPRQEPNIQPVNLLASTAQGPNVPARLVILWNDQLIQVFSWEPPQLILRDEAEGRLAILGDARRDNFIGYHHPYLTLITSFTEQMDLDFPGIEIFEINEEHPWQHTRFLPRHDDFRICHSHWRLGQSQSILDLIWINQDKEIPSATLRIDTLIVSQEPTTRPQLARSCYDIRFRGISPGGPIAVWTSNSHIATHGTCRPQFSDVSPDQQGSQRYSWIDMTSREHATLPDFRIDCKGNIVAIDEEFEPLISLNTVSPLSRRPSSELGSESRVVDSCSFHDLRIKELSSTSLRRISKENITIAGEPIGYRLVMNSRGRSSSYVKSGFHTDDERILTMFAEEDPESLWVRVQVYDFRYGVDAYLAFRNAGRAGLTDL